MTSSKLLPKQVLVYVADYDNGEPIFAVALSLTEIPDDHHGELVGTYDRVNTGKFSVTKAMR